MNVTVSTKHLEVPDAMKQYAEEKFSRAERFLHTVQSIDVVLKSEDKLKHCEVKMMIKNHDAVVIDVGKDTIQEAIDLAIDKCERQLRKLKERTQDKRRKSTVMRPPVA